MLTSNEFLAIYVAWYGDKDARYGIDDFSRLMNDVKRAWPNDTPEDSINAIAELVLN